MIHTFDLRCLLILTLAQMLAFLAPAHAGTLVVSPAVIELQGGVGQATQQSITISNQTEDDRTFEPVANDVVVVEGHRQFKPAGEIPGSIAASVVFVPKRIHVPAMQSRSVTVNASIPNQARHRAIVAIFAPVDGAAKGLFVTTAGVLMTFSLGTQEKLEASTLNVTEQTRAKNLSITTVLSNTGGEPLIEQGLVVIQNPSGRIVGKIPTPRHRLLPYEVVDVVADYPGELLPGQYNILATFEYGSQSVTLRRTISVP